MDCAAPDSRGRARGGRGPVVQHANEASRFDVRQTSGSMKKPSPTPSSTAVRARLASSSVIGPFTSICAVCPRFLELPSIEGAVRQAHPDAVVLEEVGRDARPAVLLEICRGADDGVPLWTPQRNRDHVAGHEVGRPHAEIEALGDDVDQSTLRDEIHMHLRVASQELQHERVEELARRGGEGVDAQRARWRRLLRPHRFHGAVNVAEGRRDLVR